MTRRIVQISAIPATTDVPDQLFALDNNGFAWVMTNPYGGATWKRLPPLPSLENRPRPGVATSLEQAEGIEP